MTYWILFLSSLTIPVIMLIIGLIFTFKPPKEINELFGYRTNLSMKNLDTWNFANRYIGRVWLILSLFILPLTIVVMLLINGEDEGYITTAFFIVLSIQLLIMLISIIPTEIALNKKFNKDGTRRK